MNKFYLLISASILVLSGHSANAKLVFICHKGLGYDAANVRRAYTGQLDEPHMADNKTLRSELLKHIDYSAADYKKMWTKQYFRRAIVPPILMDSDAAVIDFVASHTEGLGYVAHLPTGNSSVEVCGN